MQVKKEKFTFWLLIVLSLMGTLKTQTCGVTLLQEQPTILSNTSNAPINYVFTQDNNGQQLTLSGVISIENNGNVEYPLFQVSSQPNQGETDFPASLSNIASATYSTVDPTNSLLTLTVAADANDLDTENFSINLPYNEDIAWAVTFDYLLGVTKFLFRTKNAQVQETFQTNFPEFYLRRNLQVDLGCNVAFASQCGVLNSKRLALIQQYYDNANQVTNLTPSRYGYVDYSYDFYNNGSILVTQNVEGVEVKTPNTIGTNYFRTQDGLVAFKGQSGLQQSLIDTSNGEGYVWFAVFSYQEPLPENFLLFRTIDETAHPFEIRLVRQASGRRSAVVEFTNDNLRLQSGEWYSENNINELTFVLEQQLGAQQLHLINVGGDIVSSEIFAEPTLSFSGRSQFFGILNEAFDGEFRLYDFTEVQNSSGVFFNLLRDPAQAVPAACQTNCLYRADVRSGVNNTCLQCKAGFVLDQTTQTCIAACPAGYRNVAGRCYLCQTESCLELQQVYFAANKLSGDSFEIVELQSVPGLVQPFSDNFNVALDQGLLGDDYTWDIQNQANPNRAVYTLRNAAGFNPVNPTALISLNNASNLVDDNLNVVRNQFFTVGLDGELVPVAPVVTTAPVITTVPVAPIVTTPVITTVPVAPVVTTPVIAPVPVAPVVTVAPVVVPQPRQVLPAYVLTDPCVYRSPNGRCERVHKSVENDFKGWAIATFVIWVIGMLIGACALCFKCPALRHNGFHDFFYQKWLQSFLMAYFIAFWALYHVYHPRNLRSFLRRFLDLLAVWHGQLWDRDHPIYDEHRNFYENNIYNMFVISFGFPQVLILFILVLAIIVFLIYSMQKKKLLPERFNTLSPEQKIATTKSYRKWHCIYRFFFYMALYTVWMMFCIEAITFIIYNFMHYDWDVDSSAIKRFSLAWAIIFLIIYLVLLAINWMIGLSDRSHLYVNTYEDTYSTNNYYHDPWWFVQTGLKRTMPHRIFQSYQYFFYMLFAFLLAVAYDSRITQIIIPFFFFLILYFVFVIALRPAVSRFWQIEQIIAHTLLFLAYLFELILVLDDSPQNISGTVRWRLGYVVAFFAFMTILWNALVLIGAFIYYFLLCKKARAGMLPLAHGVGAMRMDRDHETNIMLAKNVNGDYQTVQRNIHQDRFVPVGDHLISNLSQEKFRSEQKVRNVLSTIPADVEYKQGVNVLNTPGQVVNTVTNVPGQVVNTVTNVPGQVVNTVTTAPGQVVNTVTNPALNNQRVITNTVTDRFMDGTQKVTTNVVRETKQITQGGVNKVHNVIR